jgi:cobalt-zinc-cadmium resistance protein CzcA
LRFLDAALRRPRIVLGVAAVFLVASLALLPLLGAEFIPTLDEGSIAVNVVKLPNASLDGSVATAGMIEARVKRFPEVATVVTKTGRAEISEDPMGPEQHDVFIMLHPRREWRTGRSKPELIEALNADLSSIPGIRLSFSQPIALRVNELISGVKSDLAVKVFGPDLDVLKQFADRAAVAVSQVPGARDVKVEQVAGMEQIDIEFDRDAMARYGINAGDVNEILEAGVAGRPVTRFVEAQQRFAVVVRFPEAERSDVAALNALLVPAPGGERVPLGQLVTMRTVEGAAQISREKGMRRVVVESNVRGRDLGSFVEDVQAGIQTLVRDLPSGYWVEFGGQFEQQQRAMRQLAIVVPIVLLLVFVLLYSALGSVKNALLVVLNLPFALVGGIIGAVVFRMHLSVSAAVAFIVLLGVAVQNGVVLVAFFRQLRERGHSVAETVREGCDLRFRPLFMTALTSFLGHVPMLWAMGSGGDIQKPLAVIVMGGIVTSTLLTLIVLPVIYSLTTRDAAAVAS